MTSAIANLDESRDDGRLFFYLRWLFFSLSVVGLTTLGIHVIALFHFYIYRGALSASLINFSIFSLGALTAAIGSPLFLCLSLHDLWQQRKLDFRKALETKRDFLHIEKLGSLRKPLYYFFALMGLTIAVFLLAVPEAALTYRLTEMMPRIPYAIFAVNEYVLLPLTTIALSLFSLGSILIGSQIPALPHYKGKKRLLTGSEDKNAEKTSLDILAIEKAKEATCPVCGTAIEEAPQVCSLCHTVHHTECWDYAGGCAIFGCEQNEMVKNRKQLALKSPKEEQNFKIIKSETESWLKLAKINWTSFCLASFGMVVFSWSALAPLAVPTHSAIVRIANQFGLTAFWGGISLSVIGLVSYLLSLLPVLKKVKTLNEVSSLALGQPHAEGKEVLERLETKSQMSLLLKALFISPAISLFTILMLPLVFSLIPRAFALIPMSYRFGIILLGLLFAFATAAAAKKRVLFQQTIQNRIEASLLSVKGK